MKILQGRNVTHLLPLGIQYLMQEGRKEESRNGPVYVATEPVMSIYDRPDEKVLFSAIRDANPTFHLLESLWMLDGNNDAEFLNYYVKDFGERFADDGIIHGAYGYRWRKCFGFDQIKECINKLKKDSLDRQAVIQMWDPLNDLKSIVKDRPCNTQIYLRVNNGRLDLTTTSRSHDLIWGAYGANAVHFPILQEYIAGMLGIPIGRFYQFSNNYHLYEGALDTLRKRIPKIVTANDREDVVPWIVDQRYDEGSLETSPLVTNPDTFDDELKTFMACVRFLQKTGLSPNIDPIIKNKGNSFLWNTAWQMTLTHSLYKKSGANAAWGHFMGIGSTDWRQAMGEWLERRIK